LREEDVVSADALQPSKSDSMSNMQKAVRQRQLGATASTRAASLEANQPKAGASDEKLMMSSQSVADNSLAIPASTQPPATEAKGKQQTLSDSTAVERRAAGVSSAAALADRDQAKDTMLQSPAQAAQEAETVQAAPGSPARLAAKDAAAGAAAPGAAAAAVGRRDDRFDTNENHFFADGQRAAAPGAVVAKKAEAQKREPHSPQAADAQLRLAEQLARDPATSPSAVSAYQRCLSPDLAGYFSAEALQDIRAQLERLTSGTLTPAH
jgi:hypothetical protein